jgi:hypothetical protein
LFIGCIVDKYFHLSTVSFHFISNSSDSKQENLLKVSNVLKNQHNLSLEKCKYIEFRNVNIWKSIIKDVKSMSTNDLKINKSNNNKVIDFLAKSKHPIMIPDSSVLTWKALNWDLRSMSSEKGAGGWMLLENVLSAPPNEGEGEGEGGIATSHMMMMMNSALSHTLTICNCTPATEKIFELPLGTSNG